MKTAGRVLALTLVLGVLAGAAVAAAPVSAVAAASSAHQHEAKPAAPAAAKTVEPAAAAPKGEGGAVAAHHAAEGDGHKGEGADIGSGSGATHEGEPRKAGLPQLDPSHFPGQIFWLLISFSLLYLLMANIALPGVKATQDSRRRAIKRDLAEAKAASEAAQAAQALSDKVMGEARAKAMAAVAAIKASAAEESSGRQGALQRELAQRLRDSEAKIAMARTSALREVHDKAAGIIAAEIMKKVAGMSVDPSRLTLPAADGVEGRA